MAYAPGAAPARFLRTTLSINLTSRSRLEKLRLCFPVLLFNFLSMPQADRALAILQEWVQSESLRKHCYAVADSVKHFAQLRGEDVDLWEAVGLLHDMDYERHPNLERSSREGHPFVGVAW